MSADYAFLFYAIILLTFLLLAIGIALMIVVGKQKQIKLLRRQAELELAHSNELLLARVAVQEQSMALISEEIHDNVNQILLAARMQLKTMETDNAAAIAPRLLLCQAMDKLRNISHSLHSGLLEDMGLIRSVQREMEIMSSAGVEGRLEVVGHPLPLAKEQELLIFRIIQESIQNTLKHAEAVSFRVAFTFTPAALSLEISDDGKGFDPVNVQAGGLGLLSIHNRAALLNATMNRTASIGNGSNLQLNIPIPA